MSNYQYPSLSTADIVAVISQSQMAEISPADLAHPSPELVSSLYSQILLKLDSFQDDHGQVDFEALETLENPDLHVESVRTMNLCNKIRQIMAALLCPEKFTLRDLLRPDPKRTELFLSAVLNFFIHKDAKMNILSPLFDELSLFDEQRKEFEEKISQLNGEITDLMEARERDMPLVQEVEGKIMELRQSIPPLNNEQMSLRASFRQMKEKAQGIDEKISNVEFALVQAVQESANLRSKIVQSPDKLQRALEEKKLVQVEAKNAERSAMLSFQEKTAAVEVCTKAHKKMLKHFSQMQALQEQVDSAKSIEKDVKVAKAKLSDLGVEDKSLEAKWIELQGKAEQLDESLKKLQKERDLRYETGSKKLNDAKMEVESRRRGLEARQREVEVVVSEVDAIISKINSVNEFGVAKRQELLRKSEEVVKEFQQYSNSIQRHMAKD